jgi:hypothetical protein
MTTVAVVVLAAAAVIVAAAAIVMVVVVVLYSKISLRAHHTLSRRPHVREALCAQRDVWRFWLPLYDENTSKM